MNSVILYSVTKKDNFKINTHSLIDLYLPIIGHVANNFFMMLSSDVSYCDNVKNLSFSLQDACTKLNCSYDELTAARKKLEAMGLIETFLPIDNKKNFLFVLNNPLDFYEFISKPKYKVLLIKNIGLTNFQFLEYKYLNSNWEIDNKMLNVSSTFESVFNDQDIKQIKNLDFSIIYQDLLKLTSINIVIPQTCKDIIENVYLRHSLSLKKIEQAILDSIDTDTNNNCICNQAFLVANLNKIINEEYKMIPDKQKIGLKRDAKLFQCLLDQQQEQEIIVDYKSYNAEQYLMYIFNNHLSSNDRKIIGQLKKDYQLIDETINVLIDFVLFRTKGKLNKKYIFKTAKTINGLNINTCETCVKYFKDFVQQHKLNPKNAQATTGCGMFKL